MKQSSREPGTRRGGATPALLALLGLLLLLLALAPQAHAAGVIEIGPARVLAGGVTPGDAPGYPATLSQAGSYVLTGNLEVADPNQHGIEITTDGVSINLNGFQLRGPVVCTGAGSTISCSQGSGIGIFGVFPGGSRITVREGSVRGFGTGLLLNEDVHLTDIVVSGHRGNGSFLGQRALVARSVWNRNGGDGLGLFLSGLVFDTVVSENGANGIDAGTALNDPRAFTLLGITARGNAGRGVLVPGACVIRNTTATFNGGDGIEAGAGCVVSDNVASQNGGDGIQAGAFSAVQRNTSRINQEGLRLETGAAYRENATGTVVGQGLNAGANVCVNQLCP